jgi:non-heme chloroperoxidase
MRADAAARHRQRAHAAPQTGKEAVNLRILGGILKKDVLSLYPLVLLTTLLFAGDVFIVSLDLVPLWPMFRQLLLLFASTILVFSVFQLDAPVSMVDDWLCRPVPRKELLAAKLTLIFSVIYLSRAVAAFLVDLGLGHSVIESVLDAVLLRDRLLLIVLPILLITAVVTRTLVQGIGVLLAIFVCVFMIPTPFLRPHGPLEPGIREALLDSGINWLATTPAKVVSIILVALAFWLVYWRRRILQARVLLVVTLVSILLLFGLPMALLPWKATFALQAETLPGKDSAGETTIRRIQLRNPRICFPATRLEVQATDAAFSAARQMNGLGWWDEEALLDAGPGSITFITSVEPRSLPLDWRVKLNYVEAIYSAGGAPLYSLRPAHYITDNAGGSLLSHAWVLPGSALQRLKRETTSLHLNYFLTLLKPRHFNLPTDGKRHELPGLGFCSARLDATGRQIDVDCFAASKHPAQISAELNGISASRVYSLVDFAPAWTQWPYSQRLELSIGSPRLANHGSITVSAWDVAGYVEKSLTLPGILGADTETCPLPGTGPDNFGRSRWSDAAPHEPYSIRVDEGVQLEVLDFGGQGTPILLLPGLGATAHTFDDLAPLLARKHRVVAMTRRGTGYSSKPDSGFDTPRLAQDVLQVMDAMELGKVWLIGSSIAGDELTWLGGHHPERISGLVYLDAAYDRSEDRANQGSVSWRELNRRLPPEPPIPPSALVNYDAMTKLLEERGHVRYPEGELIAMFQMNNPWLAGTPNIDGRTQQAISAAIQAPDYRALKIPALAIYAIRNPDKPLPPWYDASDAQLAADLAELTRIRDAKQRSSIELFRSHVVDGQVLEMPNATHFIYQSNQAEVLEAIEAFISH